MKMKSSLTRNAGILLISAFAAVILFSTCEQYVALGASVDILPPQGEILYPDSGETPIRGSFVIKGTANDDEGIAAVSLVFQNIETKQKTQTYNAQLDKTSAGAVFWTAHINNESQGTESGHDLVKLYPIPDGEYTAFVTLTDSKGKTTRITKNYKIDNTAPVFIVTRPSTYVQLDVSDPSVIDNYGANFSVSALAGEKNTVEELSVSVPEKNIRVFQRFVGKNIDALLTSSGEEGYTRLTSSASGTSAIRADIVLSDNAREYKGTAESGTGNSSAWYYLRDEIYNAVTAKGYTAEVISDYFAGKKGSNNNKHEKLIQKLRTDTEALQALKDKRVMLSEERSIFKLDPSKSPGFRVENVRNLVPVEFNLTNVSTALFKEGVKTPVNIELIPNRDGQPIAAGSSLEAYRNCDIRVVMYTWKKNAGNEAESLKNFIKDNLDEKEIFKFSELTDEDLRNQVISKDGNKLKLKINLPADFSEGYYLIRVEGTDTSKAESNTFAAYDENGSANGGIYVCKYLSAGGNVRVRPLSLQNKFVKENFDIFADVTGLGNKGTVYYAVDADDNSFSEVSAHKLVLDETSGTSETRYKATVDISSLTSAKKDGTHKVYFKAVGAAGGSDSDSLDFIVDTIAPEAKLTYPSSGDPQAGTIPVSGTITDNNGSGVKADGTKWCIVKTTAGVPGTDASDWQPMNKSSSIVNWSFDLNFAMVFGSGNDSYKEYGTPNAAQSAYYDIPLYVLTEDTLGNKAVRTLTLLYNPEGTKPVMTILAPTAGTTVGGTIQVFGTGRVAVGTPNDISEVYIQFSKSTTFDKDNCLINGDDWWKDENGKPVFGASGALGSGTGASWRLEVNGDEKLNPAGQNWQLYFRVRGKNKTDNKWGEWTTPVEITIDKDAPTIGSKSPLKLKNGSSDIKDYLPNMWIKNGYTLTGSLHDGSGIKTVTVRGDLENGKDYNLDTAVNSGLITVDAVNAPSEGGSEKNYILNIPLELDKLTQAAKDKKQFTFTVTVTDGQGKSASKEFSFQFDTDNPVGDFGEKLYASNKKFTENSVTDATLADMLKLHEGKKLLIENTLTAISNVSAKKVSFTPSVKAGTYNYILYEPKAVITDSVWTARGVANDDGSEVKEVTVYVEVGSTKTQPVTCTLTDQTNKIARELGKQCTWQAQINLASLPDGKGKIYYTVTDNSGNSPGEKSAEIFVRRKALSVDSVSLFTKIGDVDSNAENIKSKNSAKTDEKKNFSAVFEKSDFSFKSLTDSKIKLNLTGTSIGTGEGAKTYTLYYDGTVQDDGSISNKGTALDDHKNKNWPSDNTITLTRTDLEKIGNSDGESLKTLVVEIRDSYEGIVDSDASAVTVAIQTKFGALDKQKPTVVILPFKWNGETDNSVYENKRENGHVEIAPITEFSNQYSSVSGKVSIRGFAYDNVKIESLTATLPKNLTVTATKGAGSGSNGSTWTSDQKIAVEGAELTVTRLAADYSGYYAEWQLDWDTSKADVGLAQDAQKIKVIANDGRTTDSEGNSEESDGTNMPGTSAQPVTRGSGTTASGAVFKNAKPGQFVVFTDNGEKQSLNRIKSVNGNIVTLEKETDVTYTYVFLYDYKANKTKTKVNVVPYVTQVTTSLSALGGNDPDLYARTALGSYTVRDKETITIKGFNLKNASCTVGGINSNSLVSASEDWTLTLDSGAKSGDLELKVNGTGGKSVAAINNKNNNDKPYNKSPKTANNDKLTDDLRLDVWAINSEAVLPANGTISDAVMKINPKDGFLGFAFANGADLFSMPDADKSYKKRQRNWDDYGSIGLAYGSDGTAHAVAAARDTNYGNYTSGHGDAAGPFTYFSTVNTGGGTDASEGYKGTGGYRLESLATPETNAIFNKNRIKSPSFAVSTAGVYLAYYDAITEQIRFRHKGQLDQHSVENRPKETPESDYSILAGKNTGNTAGEFVSIAVKPGTTENDDVVVAVWYTGQDLMYAYKESPANDEDATASGSSSNGKWSKPVKIFDNAGEYCQVAVDKNGGIHIACYHGTKADLLYAFISSHSKTSEVKTCSVDSFGITGTNITLDVAFNKAGHPVPYIGYYMNSTMKPKLAYMTEQTAETLQTKKELLAGVDNDMFTGKWEISVLPTENRVDQNRINVGVWKDNGVIKQSVTGSGSSAKDSGTVYGNKTENPVLAYVIRKGKIETAQKK